PQYIDLKNQGFWKYVDGGVRGIVIFHGYDDAFYAYERNCPYQSNDSCATVTVLNDNVYLQCGYFATDTSKNITKCCGSTYFLDGGTLAQGPSQVSLKQYYVTRNGSFLQV